MRYTVQVFLFLIILGIIFVGCYLKLDSKPKTERYIGTQTVEALMKAFDARYSSTAPKWASETKTSDGEQRSIEFTLADMDAKYPRDAWLQMLRNKGITIENFKNYSEYLNIRADLILEEFYTDANWETVKAAYMDTQIQEYRHKPQNMTETKQTNAEVTDWIVADENAVPNIPGRIYIQKTESTATIWHTRSTKTSEDGEILSAKGSELAEKQKLDLLNTGVAPKGWEVIYLDEDGNPIR